MTGSNSNRNGRRRRQTDLERLCHTLACHPLQQASLPILEADLGWNSEKLARVIERGLLDESCAIERVRGGRSIRFRGSESRGGRGGVGLYHDVARVVERHWAPDRHCRDIEMFTSARPKRRTGRTWMYPDLVMACHPGRKSTPDQSKRLFAFEIETAKGFTIQSVYQAHAEGRGADYSWVAYQHTPAKKPDENPDWDRILTTARELGIGLAGFAIANAYATWHVDLEAKRRTSTIKQRSFFCEFVLGRPI